MKQLFSKQILAAGVIFAALMSAFASAEEKTVRVVNIEQAILGTDVAKEEIKKIEADAEFKKNMAQIQKIQEEGQKLTEKYKKDASMMSPKDVQELEAKIKSKQADLEHLGKKVQEVRANFMRGMMIRMNSDVTLVVKEIIDAEKIGLLLPANPQLILHADPSMDITPKVTEKLNKKFKK